MICWDQFNIFATSKKKIYQAKSRITGKRRAIKVILHEEENKLKNAVKIVKET